MTINEQLCKDMGIALWQGEAVIALLDEGNTLPFIARYRKEAHGSLDDQKLRDISERLTQLRALDERRQEIAGSLQKLGVWTEELQAQLDRSETMGALEDIYRPFRPKRKTRASVAKEKGLEPLADTLLLQMTRAKTIEELTAGFVDEEKGVASPEEALQGAMDIIAEKVSDDPAVRTRLKTYYASFAQVQTSQAQEGDSVYQMYYDRHEPLKTMPSHRILAMDRGEKEGWLKVGLTVPPVPVLNIVKKPYVLTTGSLACGYVEQACEDAYQRLIAPSLDNELRKELTERAQAEAIRVFALNLKPLLMQPPLKGKRAIALDPGYRMGCKAAVVDETGKVLDTAVIYPLPMHGEARVQQSKQKVKELILRHGVSIAAIGNGTAGHETEEFFVQVMNEMGLGDGLAYMVVNEAGASVWSASKMAAEEFPDMDVNLRSAVSLARRLQDPLAELVKIDPKAVGVGQYQHDLKEKELDSALSGVVEDCVNAVGVDVNTASPSLLSHVAGINSTVAKNIVKYREENGAFTSRVQLKKVEKLGPKAFQQCAGFLRIAGGKEPIDNTGVHPESYPAAKALLKQYGLTIQEAAAGLLTQRLESENLEELAAGLGIGVPTLQDIVAELSKPGRDPRDKLPKPLLRHDIMEMKDLVPGMELKGTVRNVVDFGAFVDIGVHQDGLIHVSRFPGRIRHPSEAVRVGDVITVYVQEVDVARKRIALTLEAPKKKG